VFMGQAPRPRRVCHAHAAVFPPSTEVRPLHTTRTQCKVKRRYIAQTEPSLASNLCVTLPCRIVKDWIRLWKQGVSDLAMALGCALHTFRVRLTPWQPIV